MIRNKFLIWGILILSVILGSSVTYSNNDRPLKDKKIVIDPGHGGKDSGVLYDPDDPTSLKEKEVNLAVALMLKSLLEDAGATVFMTRESDVDIDVYQRADIANKANADYFISIHFNATDNDTTNYTQGCYNPEGPNSTIAQELATLLQQYLHEALGIPQSGPDKRPNLVVLNRTNMPAVLMECSFISCTEEEKLLKGIDRRR